MDKTLSKSRGITAFGITMVLGGLALLLSVAMLGFGAKGALANTAQAPLAQGTQPIIVTPTLTLTSTPIATNTVGATREPTATAGATGTVVATGTVEATATAAGTVEATATAVGTVVGTTTVEATVEATSTSIPVATTEPFPTEGMIETATPISVGMPSTGSPVGGNNSLMLTLLIVGVMMTTIGLASLAARKRSYKR